MISSQIGPIGLRSRAAHPMIETAKVRLFRSVNAAAIPGSEATVPSLLTTRAPGDVPFFVDSLWNWRRSESYPTRRQSVCASPTPELALNLVDLIRPLPVPSGEGFFEAPNGPVFRRAQELHALLFGPTRAIHVWWLPVDKWWSNSRASRDAGDNGDRERGHVEGTRVSNGACPQMSHPIAYAWRMKSIRTNNRSGAKPSDNPTAAELGLSPTDKSTITTRALLVPECDSARDLHSFLDDLEQELQLKPDELTLRFIGVHEMHPDPALLIHHFLLERDSQIRLRTEAYSPILNGGVLLWLLGDIRFIRPTAWIYFRHPDQKVRRPRFEPPWVAEDLWWRGESPASNGAEFVSLDYRTIVSLIDQYLPVADLAGNPVTPDQLRQFGLIDSEELDQVLLASMAPAVQSTEASLVRAASDNGGSAEVVKPS